MIALRCSCPSGTGETPLRGCGSRLLGLLLSAVAFSTKQLTIIELKPSSANARAAMVQAAAASTADSSPAPEGTSTFLCLTSPFIAFVAGEITASAYRLTLPCLGHFEPAASIARLAKPTPEATEVENYPLDCIIHSTF